MRNTPVLLFVVAVVCVVPVALAGSLTPPGAPAATMKTLDEVEARTPISSIPSTISASGSYYLTQDLGPAVQDTDGITILASNVTLDLNGFAVIGAGKTTGSSGHGIRINGFYYNVTIRNGTIRDWREQGIYSYSGAANNQYESLRCYNNGSHGLYAGTGCIVAGCACRGNGGNGIYAFESCTVTGNVCSLNGGAGIYATQGSTISGNTCSSNYDDGINVGVTNGGCNVSGNTCRTNRGDGIQTGHRCNVVDNTCVSNGNIGDGAGIYAAGSHNAIERNVVVTNDRGIDVDGANNYIAANRASANTTDYDIAGGNTEGAGDLANVAF